MNTGANHGSTPPRQKPPGVSFVLAVAGLFVIVAGADLLVQASTRGLPWLLLAIGSGLVVLAVLLAVRRQ